VHLKKKIEKRKNHMNLRWSDQLLYTLFSILIVRPVTCWKERKSLNSCRRQQLIGTHFFLTPMEVFNRLRYLSSKWLFIGDAVTSFKLFNCNTLISPFKFFYHLDVLSYLIVIFKPWAILRPGKPMHLPGLRPKFFAIFFM